MATEIHPTALVDPRARIEDSARIGAYSVIGPDAVVGPDVEIAHHVTLLGRVILAAGVKIGPGSIVGGDPQDLKFKSGTPSGVRIGAATVLREYVTIHRASKAETCTEIGAGCLLMTQSHVGHDCRVGDGAIIVNEVAISGHCEIGERATIGGVTGIVQFCRVGDFAYVGGCSKITHDVPPYVIADGNPALARGINVVGLRRAGLPPADRRALQDAYRVLYRSGLAPKRAVERLREASPRPAAVERLIEFVETSKRGICRAAHAAGEGATAESEAVL